MPSIISASTTSGTALTFTADTSGVLALQTGATPTTAVTIDTSQNVGIGTSSVESGFKLHVVGNAFVQNTAGQTVGKVVVDNADNRLVLGSYFEAGVGQYSFISSTNNAETGNIPLLFNTGSTERMRIDSSGNVGIGTSSPGSKLQINDATAARIDLVNTNGTTGRASAVNGTFFVGTTTSHPTAFITGDTERMRIDSSGNVGIGTSSPSQKFHVSGGFSLLNGLRISGADTNNTIYQASGDFSLSSDGGNVQVLVNPAGAYFRVLTGGQNERMRITSDGDLLVGTTTVVSGTSTDRSGIVVKGTVGTRASMKVCANNDTATFALIIFANDTDGQIGSVTQNSNGTVNYNTNSDYRLKENITPMTGALEKVSQLKPCVGNWRKNGSYFQGFIAHELAEVCPEAVTGEKDAVDEEGKPVYQGVDTSFLVATLTAAIQELKAELDATKAEVAALKGAK